MTYTAAQLAEVANALDFVAGALDTISQGHLSLGSAHIQEAEGHLCRAHASLQALLKGGGKTVFASQQHSQAISPQAFLNASG
jgi:hypothetical protein